MIRRPRGSTRTDTRFPYTPRFRSNAVGRRACWVSGVIAIVEPQTVVRPPIAIGPSRHEPLPCSPCPYRPMIHRPQPSPYRPEKTILALGEAFYDQVEAAEFPQTILRFRNQRWAEAVGLGGLSNEEWLRHFGRFEALPDNLQQPLALRYHGHQFRVDRKSTRLNSSH